MEIRNTKPSGNKFYITRSLGGYSWCIQGSPTDWNANVLSNCVGYACGRFNEIIGEMKYPAFNCNAELFIERSKSYYPDLEIGMTPKAGAIAVWHGTGSLAGHVAIVERVIDANTIYTSESNYGAQAFLNVTRSNSNGRWGTASTLPFLGFIYNPAVKEEPIPTPTPGPVGKFNIGDKVVINGPLYVNSNAANATGSVENKVTIITRRNDGSAHPYNTTGDIGWMDESSITAYVEPTPAPTPQPTGLQAGDTVKIIGTGNSTMYGNGRTAYGIGWTRTILEVKSGVACPYRVGNASGTTGYYSASSLQKL